MVSTVTITKNEAHNIERCLKSLSGAYERVVVDSGSTDDTVSRAKARGAVVYHKAWTGFGLQKNFGAKQTHSDWVLFIDADEEVSPELWEEIKKATSKPEAGFYWLKIVTVFLGRPLAHLYGHNLRLFKKTAGRWTDAKVHEQVSDNDGEIIKLGGKKSRVLKNPLWHHSHPTIASYLQTMREYTRLDAQNMVKNHRHRSGRPARPVFWLPWWLAGRQFLKLLFYRQGWRDGKAGFIWCLLSGYYEYEMGRIYLDLSRHNS